MNQKVSSEFPEVIFERKVWQTKRRVKVAILGEERLNKNVDFDARLKCLGKFV